MTLPRRLRHSTALVVVCLLAALWAVQSAASQATTVTTTTTTTETVTNGTVSGVPNETTPEEETGDEEEEGLAVLILVFGGFLAVSVLYYVARLQGRYYDVVSLLSRGGVVPKARMVSAFSKALADSSNTIDIDGPSVIVAGEKTDFTALKDGQEVDATWEVKPTDFTKPIDSTKETKSVTVEGVKKGTFALIASSTLGGGTVLINVIELPTAQDSTLPFVGEGYGAVVIAIVILALASVLALMDKFSSDAVATLFGAVAGYIFYRAQQGSGSGSGGENTSPS